MHFVNNMVLFVLQFLEIHEVFIDLIIRTVRDETRAYDMAVG